MRPLGALFVALAMSCGNASDTARVRAHLERVERELHAAQPAPSPQRAFLLERLREYIKAERYPVNDVAARRTPIFVDDDGNRCAMAALIESTGGHALVERVRRTNNLAYIAELAHDDELVRWLADNDLTLDEAARIQPAYDNIVTDSYVPTASVAGAVVGGAAGFSGLVLSPEASLAPLMRVGVRRVQDTQGACDRCVYTSQALVVEASRLFALAGRGSTNHVGLLLQWDLHDDARERQLYAIGGPVVSLDDDGAPGFGVGGEGGIGFGMRRQAVPLFIEAVASGMAHDGATLLRGALVVGLVW